jgi:hypothetical protein
MENKKFFGGILIFGILIFTIVSAANIFYYKNGFLDKEIEDHLKSVVEIKGERINDYFIERNSDLNYISEISEVKEILSGNFVSSKKSLEDYLNYKLKIISKQLEIIIEKYPGEEVDYFNQEDFKQIISQSIGKTGFTYLGDSLGNVVIGKSNFIFGNFQNTLNQSFNVGNKNYYLSGFGNSNEFLISEDIENMNILDLFFEVSNYSNLMLVTSSGNVVYDSIRGIFYGLNLNDYLDTEISKAYLEVLSTNENLIYGPYKLAESNGLELLFISPVYLDGVVLGYVFLVDGFETVEKISLEEVRVGQDSSFYVVKEDNLLITPIKNLDNAVLIQTINSENTKNCFEKNKSELILFEDYRGELVLGSSYYLSESGWCLISEISEKNLFNHKLNIMNFIFILIFGFFLILGILIFKKFWQAQIKIKEKILFIFGLISIFVGVFLKILFNFGLFNFIIGETYLLFFFILEIIGFLVVFSCFFDSGGKYRWF